MEIVKKNKKKKKKRKEMKNKKKRADGLIKKYIWEKEKAKKSFKK